MSFEQLVHPYPWAVYSKKLRRTIAKPHNSGHFTQQESEERGVRLVTGSEGSLDEGNLIRFYWLVDRDDGVIVDAKFQAFGHSATLGACEAACDLVVGKNYDQAGRLTPELIDRHLRDRSETPAFPPEMGPHLSLVVAGIIDAAEKCTDIPLAIGGPPSPFSAALEGEAFLGFEDLPHAEKIKVIEKILDEEVRPYIALDAGGIEIVSLDDEMKLTVAYQGSCTSCYSSVGTTLSYIQQIIRTKVHPALNVVPDYDEAPTGLPPWME